MEDLDYILNVSAVCQGPFLIRAILFYGAKDSKVQPYILIFINARAFKGCTIHE